MPGEMKRSTSGVQKNQGKVNNVHSIIQVLKEKPELSREDGESNLLHSELVHLPRRSTRWIQLVYTAGSRMRFILLGAPIPGGRRWDHETLHETPSLKLGRAHTWMSSK